MGSYDPVGYALAVDAFSHESLADPTRVPATVCAQPFQPGVNPTTFGSDYSGFLNAIGQAQQNAPQVSAEPPLRCYVFASCPSPRSGRRHHRARRHRHAHHRRHRHRRHRGDGDRDRDDGFSGSRSSPR
jgi:hypothetical protein